MVSQCATDPWRIIGMAAVGTGALMLLMIGVVMWIARRAGPDEPAPVEAPEPEVHGVPYEQARLEGP